MRDSPRQRHWCPVAGCGWVHRSRSEVVRHLRSAHSTTTLSRLSLPAICELGLSRCEECLALFHCTHRSAASRSGRSSQGSRDVANPGSRPLASPPSVVAVPTRRLIRPANEVAPFTPTVGTGGEGARSWGVLSPHTPHGIVSDFPGPSPASPAGLISSPWNSSDEGTPEAAAVPPEGRLPDQMTSIGAPSLLVGSTARGGATSSGVFSVVQLVSPEADPPPPYISPNAPSAWEDSPPDYGLPVLAEHAPWSFLGLPEPPGPVGDPFAEVYVPPSPRTEAWLQHHALDDWEYSPPGYPAPTASQEAELAEEVSRLRAAGLLPPSSPSSPFL